MIQILIAAGLVAVLSGLFAMILLLAERFLVNYGQCEIIINESKEALNVKGGQSLLNTLRNENIHIPSACGGRGTCAFCKVKITEGGGPITPTERPLLTDEEIANDVRISCQCKVRNNLKIRIPEELLKVLRFKGRVERIRELTHDIRELRIALIDPEVIEFRAGQYVQLEVPVYENNPEPTFRAYSVSSNPDDNRYIELIIRLVPKGICTTWVFEHLSEGDEVSFTGPFGDFHLSDTDSEMVWIAGGSGMAPFWSMVRYMKAHQLSRPCTYFFGAVHERDMFFVEELRALEKELPWFRYIPALSGPDTASEWAGEKGLITEVVGRIVPENSSAEGYLCGSPGMIDASIKVLNSRGISNDRIYFDKFA